MKKDCYNCKYTHALFDDEPCIVCTQTDIRTKWEPKEKQK